MANFAVATDAEEPTEPTPPPVLLIVRSWAGRSIEDLYEVLSQLTIAVSDESQRCDQVVGRVFGARLKLEWALADLATALGHQRKG